MKKTIILTLLILAGVLNSCQEFEEDFLDAPAQSSGDESVIFSTPDLARGAVDGILERMGQTNSYRGRYIPFYGFNTDTEWNYSSDDVGSSQGELMIYDATPTNTQMNRDNNVWAMMYAGIERANLCIRGLRTYGNPQPDTELGQLLGEALTYRAIYYADLLKTWGDVPARFEPISAETLYLPKTSRDVIYKQIIADLGEAETLVAWPNESSTTSTVERANKAFVKAFRARLAMVASGFQQYPDGVRRSNDPDLSVQNMYTLALNEATDIIGSGNAHLEPSFETLWRNFNEESVTAGGESLWEIPFAAGRGRVLFSFAVRHRGVDQHTGQARGGIAGPLPTVFYDFDEDDTRRDITCVPYQWGNPTDGFSQQELVGLDTWYFGKYRYEWMNRYVTSTNDDGVNKIYMRYAEVLLIAAEAANELQGAGAAAPYLKQLRRRAFPSNLHAEKVDSYVDALTSTQDMFDAIVKEHMYEFTGEMERKMNLIRWNLLGANLDEAKVKMFNLKNRTGEYSDVPTTLYYKYEEDGETLDIYGLNRNETMNPGPDYLTQDWTILEDDMINSIYKLGVNPDDRQFWPIWQVFLDASNGQLVNDYGY
ncbi:RagB/SusD family nutrient uptake outer membrane protein [Winogradskyella echinorum]|uniref:RagB/SusD family nutrient uptake outer membrane protein n=1 Tax=Winogradskyella echinorum TaxID=538189 RepID=A0ABR6XX07_9FLAO|nr:RagB/SusD family nutrient uptake outer membrane protein [Winogradskyella echinorum]MBC3845010.1 RagB/SusD family nutrient uptake outer membrane protein [Winogradskyella echinorum]MBC5749358.1 RagB/SusD family nutrient uptake outer membrane protein [Winogradskyella echinorum]